MGRVVGLAIGLALVAAPPSFALAGPPDQVGTWGPVLNWGVQGKHMSLMHDGNVMVWSAGEQARVWNPATGAFRLTPAPFGDIHCAGQVTLADGRIMVVGGQDGAIHKGLTLTTFYDPLTNVWTRGASMAYARWYPTLTTLPDGRALSTSGDAVNGTRIAVPEVYDPATDTWKKIASRSQGLYPFMYVLPNGKVFEAGTRTSTATLDLAANGGAGAWASGPTAPFGSSSYAESGATYAPGKIIRSGGADPSIARTAVIDMTAATPKWEETSPMAFPRRRHNMVLLADGSVMAVGGTRRSDDAAQAILDGEIWNPTNKTWRTVAAMSEARMYHSTALLLPDGRVVTAGGESTGRLRAQVYSPPYLYKANRPAIGSSPGHVDYAASFSVGTETSGVSSVALIRPSGVTHAIDMNQRYVPLSFTQSGSSLTVTAPPSAGHAPPGYYMLIIKDASGTPSVARWVHVGPGATPPSTIPPAADFTAKPTSGPAPHKVQFLDSSTGVPTEWAWDFDNDGSVDSTERSPQFTYTTPGTYTVKLTATNDQGSDDEVKVDHITVGEPGAPPGPSQTLTPVADAYVQSGSPTKNYGTATTLRVRGSNSPFYRSFLKFRVGGLTGPPRSATLRLYVTDTSVDAGKVYSVSNAWTETGITYNNAPVLPATGLGPIGVPSTGAYVEIDVTPAVTGDGDVSFGLATPSSNSAYFNSREAAANRPQLRIDTGATASTATARAAVRAAPTDSVLRAAAARAVRARARPRGWAGVGVLCPLEDRRRTRV